MPTTLNRKAYLGLIQEDLDWLLQQPRTLERDHIAHMLDKENEEREELYRWANEIIATGKDRA
jgi:hypothetical protein